MESKTALQDKVSFGFWVYLMSDCVLFAGLFATYAVLYTSTYGNASIQTIVDLPFVVIETLILLTSSFTVGLALLAAERGKKIAHIHRAHLRPLALATPFFLMELSEFARLVAQGSGPSHSAFLSIFFTLLGTHGLLTSSSAQYGCWF